MSTRRLALGAAVALAGCTNTPEPPPPPVVAPTAPPAPEPATTAPAEPVATTAVTAAPPVRPTHAPPTSAAPPTAGVEAGGDDDFWRRLAECESGMTETHNRYVGFYQLSRDTAAKVGIDGSEPYEEQRAAAREWARRIHPREGTSAGWPVCWWKAAA